jgi:hypothetical protein
MDFLHAHHAGEDQDLWPLIRAHNPAAGDLLDQMDADHARIGPQIDHLQNAAAVYRADASPAARQGLVEAIELLRSVLDPHLRREEDEMMPVVSRSITHAEWEAFNNTNYVQPKSKKELGHEGHWLIDNLDPERYDVVVHTVPALPRFILIHAFADRTGRTAPPDGDRTFRSGHRTNSFPRTEKQTVICSTAGTAGAARSASTSRPHRRICMTSWPT